MGGMTEAQCYIAIYGYSLFSCVDHYNMAKRYAKKIAALTESIKSRLAASC